MKRSGFKPKAPPRRPERQWEGPAPDMSPARATMARPTAASAPVPKDNPVEHEGYRRLVAARPCIACGKWGRSQAAHGPTLGKSIKADDRTCVPLCADEPGELGCHSLVDRYILFPRYERADRMVAWAQQTRAAIAAAGDWPDDLEPMPDDEEPPEELPERPAPWNEPGAPDAFPFPVRNLKI